MLVRFGKNFMATTQKGFILVPNMADPAKFGYIVNWHTNHRRERRYQGIKHPIITLIAWFSFTGKQRKCRRVRDQRTAHFT